MTVGLNPSDVVSVTISLQNLGAQPQAFGNTLIIGSSTVIDPVQRLRPYTTIAGVAADFSVTSPEYLAAQVFFSANPQPAIVYVGCWVAANSSATLKGVTLSPSQQIITNFTAITAGSLVLTVDGVAKTLTGLNFASVTNLNAVAGIVTTALAGSATVVWNSVYSRFEVTDASAGTSSTLSYATTAGSGTDVSGLLGLSAASGSNAPVAGMLAETPLAAVTALAAASAAWYGCTFATFLTDTQHLAVAGAVEAMSPRRYYGITCNEANILSSTTTTDLASVLQSLGYNHTFIQYSSNVGCVAAAAWFGRSSTVNFLGSNTTLTMKFQTQPGVVPEQLNEAQAATLKAKNCNVYVTYSDGVSFLQEGVAASGQFFDTIYNTDWFQNAAQTALFNVLLTAGTKVPQTDPGVHLLVTALEQTCVQGVTNGALAPGVWTGAGFGQIVTNQLLPKGWYIYAPSVNLQTTAARQARQAPLLQCALKMAGAIHYSSVAVSVVS